MRLGYPVELSYMTNPERDPADPRKPRSQQPLVPGGVEGLLILAIQSDAGTLRLLVILILLGALGCRFRE
jgi:hypothetical protein